MERKPALRDLMDAIAAGATAEAGQLLDAQPQLAAASMSEGATRQTARANFLAALGCYVYAGDTALHVAAAAWSPELLRRLIDAGADPTARNRRGAGPLHYAASGNPDSARWDPDAQARAIAVLVAAGADPNAADANGTTPLHRAIRTRCAAAVEALLRAGADPSVRTRNGSTCERLASVASGRGGAGSPAAKSQQARILELLADQPVNRTVAPLR